MYSLIPIRKYTTKRERVRERRMVCVGVCVSIPGLVGAELIFSSGRLKYETVIDSNIVINEVRTKYLQ